MIKTEKATTENSNSICVLTRNGFLITYFDSEDTAIGYMTKARGNYERSSDWAIATCEIENYVNLLLVVEFIANPEHRIVWQVHKITKYRS